MPSANPHGLPLERTAEAFAEATADPCVNIPAPSRAAADSLPTGAL